AGATEAVAELRALDRAAARVGAAAAAGGALAAGLGRGDLHQLLRLDDLRAQRGVDVLERARVGGLDRDGFDLPDGVARDVHAGAADGDVPVDDELARLRGRRGQALEVDDRLEAAHEDRFDVQGEDVVEARGLADEAHALETAEKTGRLA